MILITYLTSTGMTSKYQKTKKAMVVCPRIQKERL